MKRPDGSPRPRPPLPARAAAPGERAFRNEFSWSASRDRLFRECARKYYYAHYGMWGGWRRDAEPRTREIYILKNLKTRQMWAGSVVHDAIRRSLLLLRNGQSVLAVDDILRITRARMRADWLGSKRRQNRVDPKRRLGLLEHAYGLPLAPEDWRAVAGHVEHCLRNFYASPLFRQLARVRPAAWLATEEIRDFQLETGAGRVRVWIQIDGAYRAEDGTLVLLDWWTGRARGESSDDWIQRACRALYAAETWDVPTRRIRLVEFDLGEDQAVDHAVTNADLEAVRAFIGGSVLDMRRLLASPEANGAREEDFPRTPDRRRCLACPFRRPCLEEAPAMASGQTGGEDAAAGAAALLCA
jgi:hypothetical protein